MTSRILCATALGIVVLSAYGRAEEPGRIEVRAIYGGFPQELVQQGRRLTDSGINAVFVGSDGVNDKVLAQARQQGVKLFAEFNTLHVARYVKAHPDAAPVGVDGRPCPAPNGWQGVCPTHDDYRRLRMDAFRRVLATYPIDGIWLDYHHSHASWEQAQPNLPDTCFCDRCVGQFSAATHVRLPDGPRSQQAAWLLSTERQRWTQWRCDVLTDWVREFRAIRDATRPAALLGTFHCPWSETDFDGALRAKLAIDLTAQAALFDVLSPMPYHARFGHAADPAWISRQVGWLGRELGVKGDPGERLRLWPIVQLADWGEKVAPQQVEPVLRHGTARPATGVIVFHWGMMRSQPEKFEPLVTTLRSMAGPAAK
jgi:hypothetical protein